MSSFFPFAQGSRIKRKTSAAVETVLDFTSGNSTQDNDSSPGLSTVASVGNLEQLEDDVNQAKLNKYGGKTSVASEPSPLSTLRWFGAVCRSVDLREVLGFVLWEVVTVLIVVLAVADWIFFFSMVVAPERPQTRLKWGALWALLTFLLIAFRRAVRARMEPAVRSLADHAEIFVSVSLVMVFSTNVSFYLHAPAVTPLRDLGFMIVPAQAVDSAWRPVSDVLTAALPVIFMVQTYLMTRENRCRVMSSFFRVATVAYALRTMTVSLTSLPGPAPHCRPNSGLYFPPEGWIDIVTRVGPMYGQFNSCGDLIFSGHMAYTNSALLLYLRVLDRYFVRYSKLRWSLGLTYLVVLAALCVAGRKHYSVDVVLGVMISTLVFFHFEHSWIPLCLQASTPLGRDAKRGYVTMAYEAQDTYYFHGYPDKSSHWPEDDFERSQRPPQTSIDVIC